MAYRPLRLEIASFNSLGDSAGHPIMLFFRPRSDNLSFLSPVPIEESSPTGQPPTRAEGGFQPATSSRCAKATFHVKGRVECPLAFRQAAFRFRAGMIRSRHHEPIYPQAVIGVLSEILPNWTSHDTLNSLFMYAGAPGEPPEGSKPAKVQAWLLRTNKDMKIRPLEVLGKILEKYLEDEPDEQWDDQPGFKLKKERNDRLRQVLAKCGLTYTRGGIVGA